MILNLAINTLVGLIALEHIYFMFLEMFLWSTPRGCKAFGMTPEHAKATASLAANQGLYNGFLALGLIWSLVANDPVMSLSLKIFFVNCVLVAGAFGGKTVSKKIFFVQGVPALITLILILFSVYL